MVAVDLKQMGNFFQDLSTMIVSGTPTEDGMLVVRQDIALFMTATRESFMIKCDRWCLEGDANTGNGSLVYGELDDFQKDCVRWLLMAA